MLRVIAFSLVLSAAFLGGIVNPFIALLGYVWFALFRPQEWLWFDVSGWRFSLWLGLLLLIRSALGAYLPNLTHRHSIAMVAVGFVAVVAHQQAIRPDISLQWLDFLLRLLIVCMLAISLLDTPRRLYWFATTMALSFGFHTTKGGLASLLAGGAHFYDGLGGAFIDNNSYAIAGVMVMPLLWAGGRLVPDKIPLRKYIRLFAYCAIPLTAFFVISTFSRSGFLALASGFLVWLLLQQKRVTTILVIATALLVVLPFVPLPEGYSERVQTIQTYEEVQETSAISRLHFWQVALRMAEDYPLGVGLFNFEPHYNDYDDSGGMYGFNRSVHSSHLQVLTEMGFIGLVLWVFLFVSSILICFKVRGIAANPALQKMDREILWTLSTAFMVSLVAFLVGGIFISMALNDLTWLLFAAVAAIDRVARAKLDEATRRPALAA